MLAGREGRLEAVLGREVLAVHAVFDGDDAVRAFGRRGAEESSFFASDEQARLDTRRDELFEGEQPPRLTLVNGRDRPWLSSRVIGPFRRVQVDKIDDGPQPRQIEHVLSHGRGKNEGTLDALAPHDVLDPLVQLAAAEIRQRQGLAGENGPGTAYPPRPRDDRLDVNLGTQRSELLHMLPVRRVVDETAQNHAIAVSQVPQQVMRTNLVALVRRIRQPVGQEK